MDTRGNLAKTAHLLSQNAAAAFYGVNHSSLNEVVHRVDEKRRRRASQLVFKTVAEDHVLVNKALPDFMRKQNSPRLLNSKAPPIGERDDVPIMAGK